MYHYPPGANVLVLLRSFRDTAITIFGVRDGTAAERLDAAENASVEDLEHFAGNWNDKSVVLEDGLVLAKCLTEISADRLFVKMPGQITATRLFSEIKKFEKLARGGIDRP